MTVGTARLAFLLYTLAAGLLAQHRRVPAEWRRAIWTVACAALLGHVLCAFALVHGWSHRHAYEHTARVTAAWTGWDGGGGIYANYAVLVLWSGDVLWWWIDARSRHGRPRWIEVILHGFLLFMYVQAAVVFVAPPARWMNLVVLLMLGGSVTFAARSSGQVSP